MNQPPQMAPQGSGTSKWIWIVLAILVLGAVGYYFYSKKSISETKPTPIVITPDLSGVTNADNQLGFKLYQEILKTDQNKNTFISPVSIALALQMAYNGADKETAAAMAKTLNLESMDINKANQINTALITSLQNNKDAQLNIANSLWLKKGLNFKTDYVSKVQESYLAKAETLDFANPKSVDTINNWVKEKTQQKINSIIDRISPDDIMFLVNAVYFKSNWAKQFEKSNTQKKTFYLANGQTKEHPLMSQGGDYKYMENKDFQAIQLPYKDGKTSMHIFLPKKESDLTKLQQKLTSENWSVWQKSFAVKEGNLRLPTFTMEYEKELNQVLTANGMGVVFDPIKANFRKMAEVTGTDNIYISFIHHKTFVDVNETGTEAAAVTAVGVSLATSIEPPKERFEMIVDRPFFFAIIDDKSGLILFMGSITNPEYK